MPFLVESEWFTGVGGVLTFAHPELFSTKIRALYQRRKGRDLFDLWLALTELGISGGEIVAAFLPYRPVGLTAALAESNLRAKLEDAPFRSDLDALVTEWPVGYDIDSAADLVIAEVLSGLDG